jgi:hypothetical protein
MIQFSDAGGPEELDEPPVVLAFFVTEIAGCPAPSQFPGHDWGGFACICNSEGGTIMVNTVKDEASALYEASRSFAKCLQSLGADAHLLGVRWLDKPPPNWDGASGYAGRISKDLESGEDK